MNDRINKLRAEFIGIVKDHDFNLNAKMDTINFDLGKRIDAINLVDDK